MPQADDQGVGAVGLELVPKLVEDLVELGQVPGPDGWRGDVPVGEGARAGRGGDREAGPLPGLPSPLLLPLQGGLQLSPIEGRGEEPPRLPAAQACPLPQSAGGCCEGPRAAVPWVRRK